MRIDRCKAIALFVVLCSSNTLIAQQATATPMITATATAESVRFLSSPTVCQMRLQVLSTAGETLFDSAWKDGNLLDWPATALSDGSYRCVIAVKDLDGAITSKETALLVEYGNLSMARDGAGSAVLLAHDGATGAVLNSTGDLTFRFGDFLARKETERMRLTAAGNLGIGTDKPQAPLDVNGVIRTSRGIEFPDGTVLTTAAGLPGIEKSGSVRDDAPPRLPIIVQGAPGVGVNGATGSGARLTPRTTAGPDYQFKVDAAGVHVGTTSAFGLDVAGDVTLGKNLLLPGTTTTAGMIMMANAPFLHSYAGPTLNTTNAFLGYFAGNFSMTGTSNVGIGLSALSGITDGGGNTAIGVYALKANTTGDGNSAVGSGALPANTTGSYNVSMGFNTLKDNTGGTRNTAIGPNALQSNSTASGNTAIGASALLTNNGNYNTATGYDALYSNSSGVWNTAVGYEALNSNTVGSYNVAIGENAGQALTTGCCNIDIGNGGVAGEEKTIRIGNNNQTRTFISGIRGVTTAGSAIAVLIDSSGQLGTLSSSRRVKFDIADAADTTDDLMRLRPVTFRYIAQGSNAPLQYGLIAEEVADVYPELVARNHNGEVETVMYQFLSPMLLNEAQKQHRRIEEQDKTIDELRAALDAVTQRLQALESVRRK